jgi:hypothetical protein
LSTLHDLLDDRDLGLLCPWVQLLGTDDRDGAPRIARARSFAAIVRLHVGLDVLDGRPLRCSPAWTSGRLIELAAGAGRASVSTEHLAGTLRPTSSRPGLRFRIGREDVEQLVLDRRTSTVQLLAPRRLGAVTLYVLGGAMDRVDRAFEAAGYPAPET